MSSFDIAKRAVGYAAQLGAGKITHTIIKNNVEAESATDRVTIAVGSYAIGGIVAEAAKNQIYRVADEARQTWHKINKKSETEKK